ncbi:MAG: hypothetical protein GF401_04325 [Chitinivibrionales bacterium]|nr:hypothetical protein [Chitinivibrionales bacterium]
MLKDAFRRLERPQTKATVSMTPLIDMVFILLIFFVVTTTSIRETGITINKAHASTSRALDGDILVIAIDKEGNYRHENRLFELDTLLSIIPEKIKRRGNAGIVIIPDRDGRVDPLIAIMDRLRANNITRFSLGTQAPKNGLIIKEAKEND